MIPNSNILALFISAGIAVFFPVALAIWFYRKEKISFVPVSAGIVTFIVFALLLEQVMHYFVFTYVSAGKENTALYVAYGCLAAGLFEESGRFIAFRFILKKRREWKDGIAYGIGHGGIEALLIGGLGLVGSAITAVMMNDNSPLLAATDPDKQQALLEAKKKLIENHWSIFLLGGIERVFAVVIHVALSIIVLHSVRTGKMIFLFYAIILHALLNVGAALYQKEILNIVTVEIIVFLFAVAAFIFLRKSRSLFESGSL